MVAEPPLVTALCGDAEISAHFSGDAEVAMILRFEAELARAQVAFGLVPQASADRIASVAETLRPDPAELGRAMARDGVSVPHLVQELRRAVGEPHAAFVHLGATSQDAIDTGLMLRLRAVLDLLVVRLERLMEEMGRLVREQGSRTLMAQTRMQAALPFTLADKLATWQRPLEKHAARLSSLRAGLPVQLGGPIGTGESFGDQYEDIRRALALRLGLGDAPSWQSDRTEILDIAQALALLAGTTAKIGQDFALMAQTGINAVRLAGGGGSSAMAHKENPVGAEVLVAIGRFNAGLLGLLGQSMIHENERSGAAWTLEWMLLPQMAETTGRAIAVAEGLVSHAEFKALRGAFDYAACPK
ncbi:3-carboxy-cis,cis-muconate cycloisomerase [Aureimonas glaciei]|uniref:3-carboxy-cis,cis-muconate cycloisomerase n=1 Tax=Aureimonas glaciei TaxID=1776957 RepID=A0A917DCB2_9HYPH|nr:3-carboxy-cis,cis-muconate cycloisomerase [Aureimonas glaciei]GGD26114.1 3-carboxy-cis,cis-muconate cycloisomerase [Aureimonas glaciei]